MKLFFGLTITQDKVGSDLYRKLGEICPAGKQRYIFGGRLPADDATVLAAMNLLAQNGFIPGSSHGERGEKFFPVSRHRVYEAADFEHCQLLKFYYTSFLSSTAYRDQDGILTLKPPKKKIASGYIAADFQPPYTTIPENDTFPAIVVSDPLQLLIRQTGLAHIILRPTRTLAQTKQTTAKPDAFAPYWEITSDLILPPLGAKSVLVENSGQPFQGTPGKGCFIREREFWPQRNIYPTELHYERSAIEEVGEFDLARTSEMTGNSEVARQWVCSQKFYRFCCQHKLKIDWTPIRIDEG